MGKLEVDVFGVSWETIWTATGNQGNAWHLATIPISGKTKLRLRGTTGSNYYSDSKQHSASPKMSLD